MAKYWQQTAEGRFQCSECGRRKKPWYMQRKDLCRTCGSRMRSEANTQVTITDGIVATKVVRAQLRKRAESDTPISASERRYSRINALIGPLTLVSVYLIVKIFFGELSENEWLVAFWTCIGVPILVWLTTGKLKEKPQADREAQIKNQVAELARQREEHQLTRERFYSDSRWIALRKQVIREEGTKCAECRIQIRNTQDITVDHVRPRSKYPELALERSNLQVLCRSCNSAKGASD